MTNPKDSTPASEPAGLTFPLKVPVRIGEAMTVTELHFPPRLQGRHLRRYTTTGNGALLGGTLLDVAADLTGQPDRVMAELDGADVAGVMEVTLGFLLRGGFLGTTSAKS